LALGGEDAGGVSAKERDAFGEGGGGVVVEGAEGFDEAEEEPGVGAGPVGLLAGAAERGALVDDAVAHEVGEAVADLVDGEMAPRGLVQGGGGEGERVGNGVAGLDGDVGDGTGEALGV
jgi:hypothetical protein